MRTAHIVVTCSTAHRARRDKLAGVVRAARKLGWRLHVVDRHPFSPSLDDILAQVVPDGFILENDDKAAVLRRCGIRGAGRLRRRRCVACSQLSNFKKQTN